MQKDTLKPSKQNCPNLVITALGIVVALSVAMPNATLAAGPPNPAVEMTFSEGTGTTTANAGFLAGSATLSPGTTTNGYPTFTNNVPTGLFTPAANAYALNMGTVDSTGGGRTVDLVTAFGASGTLGNFIGGMTICGWLNSQDNGVGSGGNRIAFALETPNGLGFDLMQQTAGALGFNVNHYTAAGPLSSFQMITENSGAAASNWVFFAVTYNPALSSGQVKFYFGRPDKLAGLDVARTYTGGPTNEIEFTGFLTIGNFSSVEGQYLATGTGSRTYRGLIDQFRIYTNILTVDEIQQAQLESSVVPPVAATILRQPANLTVTAGPLKTATFTVDAHGSGLVTYQWRTNGVLVPNATNASFTLPADTTAYSGTVVSVYVDNSLTANPGVLSADAVLTINPAPIPGATILANDDVFVDNSGAYNGWSQSQQINWGLAGANGITTGQRRSYIEFTLGTQTASSAKLKLWNYWGGPVVNGQGRPAQANSRIYGTLVDNPIEITEPPAGTHSDPTWIAPDNTNFVAIADDVLVGPDIGWYEWDITEWYNERLGQTTTVVLRGAATSGFDFPLYEDREGTALAAGAGGTVANTGPRLEIFLAPPRFTSVTTSDGNLILTGRDGASGGSYVLLSSTNPSLPMAGWTRVSTNQFNAQGQFSVTNPIASGPAQQFYRLLVP
ncbi:MAG TPA: LamG-like jellyroll fold domain-containing protein [Verrucomicrobiae bacterium]|nr:LamG-like jellyroll fold domain-containing protein [Verrucomicrobiae bacterium]